MQISKLMHNEPAGEPVSLEVIIWSYPVNCTYIGPHFTFTLNTCKSYQIGSHLTLIGRADPPSDKQFFGPKRLTIQHVTQNPIRKGSVKDWLESGVSWLMRQKQLTLEEMTQYVPDSQLGLIVSTVFGGGQLVSAMLKDQLKIVGLTYVLSASGYNAAIVVGFGLWCMQHFPRVVRVIGGLVLILSYAFLAELVPSALRATVMMGLSYVGSTAYLRRTHPLRTLLLTGLLLLCYEPWFLHSVSFWLSVAAVAGIIVFLPHLKRSLEQFQLLGVRDAVAVTLAAQLFTVPLILGVFGELSLLSVVTSVALMWLTPVITLGGLFLFLGSRLTAWWPMVHTATLQLLSAMVWLPTQLFLNGVGWFSQFRWAVIAWQMPLWAAIGWYLAVFGAIIVLSLKKKGQIITEK